MLEAAVVAWVVTFATTPVVRTGMHRLAAIDEVNERSSHRVPTPRGGGVAAALGIFAGIAALTAASGTDTATAVAPLAVAVCLFGLVGLAEDLAPIPALRRLAYHGVASLALTAVVLTTVRVSGPPTGAVLLVVCAVIGPLWVTAFVNAFNFMDGVNGISAVQAVVAGVAYALLGLVHDVPALSATGLVVAGAAAGFAPFNMPRARIFLGDVGSYSLGASLATLTMVAILAGLPPEAAVAPLTIYLADTGTTLLRRVRAGETWHKPHRSHVYQRLVRDGWQHLTVSVTVGGYVAVMSGLGLAASTSDAWGRLGIGLTAAGVVVSYLLLPGWAGGTTVRPTPGPPDRPAAPTLRAPAPKHPATSPAGRPPSALTDDHPTGGATRPTQPTTGKHRQLGRHRGTATGAVPAQRQRTGDAGSGDERAREHDGGGAASARPVRGRPGHTEQDHVDECR